MKIKATIFILIALFLSACATGTQEAKFEPKKIIGDYVAASKAKDSEKLKKAISAKSMELFEATAKAQKTSLEELLKGNKIDPMLETPELRNEKVDGEKASAEIKNPANDKWEELIFVKEDNTWKLDVLAMVEKEKKKIEEINSKEEKTSEQTDKKEDAEKKEEK